MLLRRIYMSKARHLFMDLVVTTHLASVFFFKPGSCMGSFGSNTLGIPGLLYSIDLCCACIYAAELIVTAIAFGRGSLFYRRTISSHSDNMGSETKIALVLSIEKCLYAIIIAFFFLDVLAWTISLSVEICALSQFRFSWLLRPVLVPLRSRKVHELLKAVKAATPKLIYIMMVMTLLILMFASCLYVIFYDPVAAESLWTKYSNNTVTSSDATKQLSAYDMSTFADTTFSMLVLATAGNFPGMILPILDFPAAQSTVGIVVICFYIVLVTWVLYDACFLALVYYYYNLEASRIKQAHVQKEDRWATLAFMLLKDAQNDRGSSVVSAAELCKTLAFWASIDPSVQKRLPSSFFTKHQSVPSGHGSGGGGASGGVSASGGGGVEGCDPVMTTQRAAFTNQFVGAVKARAHMATSLGIDEVGLLDRQDSGVGTIYSSTGSAGSSGGGDGSDGGGGGGGGGGGDDHLRKYSSAAQQIRELRSMSQLGASRPRNEAFGGAAAQWMLLKMSMATAAKMRAEEHAAVSAAQYRQRIGKRFPEKEPSERNGGVADAGRGESNVVGGGGAGGCRTFRPFRQALTKRNPLQNLSSSDGGALGGAGDAANAENEQLRRQLAERDVDIAERDAERQSLMKELEDMRRKLGVVEADPKEGGLNEQRKDEVKRTESTAAPILPSTTSAATASAALPSSATAPSSGNPALPTSAPSRVPEAAPAPTPPVGTPSTFLTHVEFLELVSTLKEVRKRRVYSPPAWALRYVPWLVTPNTCIGRHRSRTLARIQNMDSKGNTRLPDLLSAPSSSSSGGSAESDVPSQGWMHYLHGWPHCVGWSHCRRCFARGLAESHGFQYLVTACIILSVISLVVDPLQGQHVLVLQWLQRAVVVFVFVVEVLVKHVAFGGASYNDDWWNRLDFSLTVLDVLLVVITASAIVPTKYLFVLIIGRSARVLRMLRFLRATRTTAVLVHSIVECSRLMWILVLTLGCFIYAYAILGCWLFRNCTAELIERGAVMGYNYDALNFETPIKSMFVLFTMAVGNGW
jgi:hypothetical protein